MKFHIEVEGETYTLDLRRNGADVCTYKFMGMDRELSSASIAEVQPGVYSVLDGTRSFTIHVAAQTDELEVWAGANRYFISVADERDAAGRGERAQSNGPLDLRAQMPGKVVNVLVSLGSDVVTGQSLMVVEAMKMQNEVKAPRDGIVRKIHAGEGATVAANQPLLTIE